MCSNLMMLIVFDVKTPIAMPNVYGGNLKGKVVLMWPRTLLNLKEHWTKHHRFLARVELNRQCSFKGCLTLWISHCWTSTLWVVNIKSDSQEGLAVLVSYRAGKAMFLPWAVIWMSQYNGRSIMWLIHTTIIL